MTGRCVKTTIKTNVFFSFLLDFNWLERTAPPLENAPADGKLQPINSDQPHSLFKNKMPTNKRFSKSISQITKNKLI